MIHIHDDFYIPSRPLFLKIFSFNDHRACLFLLQAGLTDWSTRVWHLHILQHHLARQMACQDDFIHPPPPPPLLPGHLSILTLPFSESQRVVLPVISFLKKKKRRSTKYRDIIFLQHPSSFLFSSWWTKQVLIDQWCMIEIYIVINSYHQPLNIVHHDDLISDIRRMWMLRMINDIDILLSSNKVVLIVYFIESDVDVLNPLDLGWKKKTFCSFWNWRLIFKINKVQKGTRGLIVVRMIEPVIDR